MPPVTFLTTPIDYEYKLPQLRTDEIARSDNQIPTTKMVHTGPCANVFVHDTSTHEVFLSMHSAAHYYNCPINRIIAGLKHDTHHAHIPNLERLTHDAKLWYDNNGRFFMTRKAAIKANDIDDYYIKSRHNGSYEIGSLCNPRMSITLSPYMLRTHEHIRQLMSKKRFQWLIDGITYDTIEDLQYDTGYTKNQLDYAIAFNEVACV